MSPKKCLTPPYFPQPDFMPFLIKKDRPAPR
jgi:hypothetical protein